MITRGRLLEVRRRGRTEARGSETTGCGLGCVSWRGCLPEDSSTHASWLPKHRRVAKHSAAPRLCRAAGSAGTSRLAEERRLSGRRAEGGGHAEEWLAGLRRRIFCPEHRQRLHHGRAKASR